MQYVNRGAWDVCSTDISGTDICGADISGTDIWAAHIRIQEKSCFECIKTKIGYSL